jgi:phosphate starvation-inducible PhoH-like protein
MAVRIVAGIDDIVIHHFSDRDVVRHKLVQKIILAYERFEREQQQKARSARVAKRKDK